MYTTWWSVRVPFLVMPWPYPPRSKGLLACCHFNARAMQVDTLHWKGQLRHDLTLDPLLPLHMNFFILFLVGMQWMQCTAWMQCRSIEVFWEAQESVQMTSTTIMPQDFVYNLVKCVCLVSSHTFILSCYAPRRQESLQDHSGCWPVAISIEEQCRLTLSVSGVESQQTGLFWQKCSGQQRNSIMARLLTSDLLIPFDHIGFLNWNRFGKCLAIKM